MHLFVNYELYLLYLLTDDALEAGQRRLEDSGLRRLEEAGVLGSGLELVEGELGIFACLENSADFLVKKN